MNQPSIPDIVGAVVFVLALLFSREVANVVGPYMVIVAAASIGASFALARRDKTTRLAAVGYFTRVCGLAVLVTVMLATFIASYHESLTTRLLIAPVALVIGFFGDDFLPMVKEWVAAFMNAFMKSRGGGQ